MKNQHHKPLPKANNRPAHQPGKTGWTAAFLLLLVRFYRLFLSPHIGGGCRFTPTCSYYFEDAVLQRGALTGTYLGSLRLLRCGPWCQGGYDPVPAASQTLSSHLK